jgi:hypothetical protein
VSVVCGQVQASAKGRTLVQRIPTECGVSECGSETWPTRGCYGMGEEKMYFISVECMVRNIQPIIAALIQHVRGSASDSQWQWSNCDLIVIIL